VWQVGRFLEVDDQPEHAFLGKFGIEGILDIQWGVQGNPNCPCDLVSAFVCRSVEVRLGLLIFKAIAIIEAAAHEACS